MSNISENHSVIAYTGSKQQPLTGQRLAVVTYKGRTTYTSPSGATTYQHPAGRGALPEGWSSSVQPAFPALAVSIPPLRAESSVASIQPAGLRDVVASMLEGVQDNLIRDLIDERRSASPEEASINKKLSISSEEINLAAVLSFAAATGDGRMSAESIGIWFDNVLTEKLMEAILAKMPDAEDATISGALANYRAALGKLAAPKPALDDNTRNLLRKAVLMAPEDDAMVKKLLNKIDPQKAVASASLFDL